MGILNTSINWSKTYDDIYKDFFKLYNEGMEVEAVTQKLIDQNQDIISSEFSNDFLFALAKAQWDCKQQNNEIFNRVKRIIETGADLELWRAKGADEYDLKKRKRALDNFLIKLQTERVNAKPRIRKSRPSGNIYRIPVDKNLYYYCQDLGKNRYNLGGNIIRVFKKAFKDTKLPDLKQLVHEPVYFEVHTFLILCKARGWEKVGYVKFEEEIKTKFVFIDFENFSKSENAVYIKDIHNNIEEYLELPKHLEPIAESAGVFAPDNIVERIKTGKKFPLL